MYTVYSHCFLNELSFRCLWAGAVQQKYDCLLEARYFYLFVCISVVISIVAAHDPDRCVVIYDPNRCTVILYDPHRCSDPRCIILIGAVILICV